MANPDPMLYSQNFNLTNLFRLFFPKYVLVHVNAFWHVNMYKCYFNKILFFQKKNKNIIV